MRLDFSKQVPATSTSSNAHAAWIEGVVMPVASKSRHDEGDGAPMTGRVGRAVIAFAAQKEKTMAHSSVRWVLVCVLATAFAARAAEPDPRILGCTLGEGPVSTTPAEER